MSGSGDGSLIATTRNAELQVLGTGGQLAVQAWDQITGYLRRARSPAHAALFAEPNPDADRGITDWYAAGQGTAPPLETLPDAAQEAARAEFARLYGDIREEADRLRASTRESERFLGELIAFALITPATDCLRVMGGQPVLVAWGHAKLGEAPSAELLIGMTRRRGSGGLAPMQIVGPPAAPSAKRPLLFWLLGLLGLLLLLLLLLLLWRDPFGWFKAALPQCVVQPGNAELLDELRAAQAREAALRGDIAREMLRLGDRRTACPPPEPPPPPPPPQRRVEQPPPPPPALPAERWDQGELGMLTGCWELGAEGRGRRTYPDGRSESCRIPAESLCFGDDGRGTRQEVYDCPSGVLTCRSPLTGSFSGGVLNLTHPQGTCVPAGSRNADTLTCTRVSNDVARCVNSGGNTSDFRRAGGRP
ncbi:MAG: hypothetical protein INF81_10010 [Roseomonas sp.]|nr:hypothetical protein [Roseomonas sp.]MCA3430218.1 hypothetical protein [Roseomonas sp.]MCA3433329.1 hypothetical protein [Roseomonas sp.]